MTLEDTLAVLNHQIDKWNAKVDEKVEEGEVDPSDALILKVQPGSATEALVSRESRSESIQRAIGGHVVPENPEEIIRLALSVTSQSRITRDLLRGARKAKHKRQVLVKTLDLAHLLARSSECAMVT